MNEAAKPPILRIDGLTKHFGGLTAVDGVTLEFAPGRLHAVIGPNGAGKTTLFNLISGFLPSDEGRVFFAGQEITRLAPHKISRLGISRTLQVKSVFNQLSVADNLWITAQAKRGVWNPFRRTASYRESCEKVERVLEQLDLTALADRQAGTLSHGDIALLEIGMAIAAEPKLLLLDEPICGMSPAETARTVTKIRELAQTIDIVLIEHDMEVVFEIADDITVMAQGAILACGSPKEIAADERVREAYLGRPEDEDYVEEAVRA
ncbi:MAG: ABC transporter ATP-binding protein [Proteobacteria bacterium]|nr:ABC transporter ATP-binding protein [Pseudomonadota bacterium]